MKRLFKLYSRLFFGFFRLSLHASAYLIVLGGILFLFGFIPLSLAQQLIIESPSPGPLGRVIYGHLSESSVTLFEFEHKFEMLDPLEAGDTQIGAKTSEPLAANPGNRGSENSENRIDSEESSNKLNLGTQEGSNLGSQVLTSFSLGPSEMDKCTESARFKGFVVLLNALKPKAVRIVGGSEAEACGKKVMRQISTGTGVSSQFEGDDSVLGLRAEVLVFSPKTVRSVPDKAPEVVNQVEAPLVFSSVDEVIRSAKISIGEIALTPNSEGYFVLEVPEMSEVEVVIEVKGRKPIKLKTFPVLLSTVPAQVNKAKTYRARQMLFLKPALSIYITKTPFLTRKTSVDGGLGGGVGYGKEVPGERKGDRFVSFVAAESRDLWNGLGVRGSLFYTAAKDSVLPRSLTARALMIYDYPLLDDSLNLRGGAGFELFTAKVQLKRKIVVEGAEDPAALIPQQVSSPFLSLALLSAPWRGLLVSGHLGITPLYVPSIGYYPSLSPSLDLGWKFKKERVIQLSLGSETHRFPSVRGETRISLYYSMLSFKLAVF